jgi:hypothetical protein
MSSSAAGVNSAARPAATAKLRHPSAAMVRDMPCLALTTRNLRPIEVSVVATADVRKLLAVVLLSAVGPAPIHVAVLAGVESDFDIRTPSLKRTVAHEVSLSADFEVEPQRVGELDTNRGKYGARACVTIRQIEIHVAA